MRTSKRSTAAIWLLAWLVVLPMAWYLNERSGGSFDWINWIAFGMLIVLGSAQYWVYMIFHQGAGEDA